MIRIITGVLVAVTIWASNEIFLWQQNGIPIRQAVNLNWNRVSDSTPDGDLILAWADSRNGVRKVYAQKIDGAGNTLWGADGIPISSEILLDQESQVIVSDGFGGAFIAWLGRGAMDSCSVITQHIEANGDLTWGANGLVIDRWYIQDIKSVYDLKMVAGLPGQAFIMWDYAHIYTPELFITKLNLAGALAPRLVQSDSVGNTDIAALDSGAVIIWSSDQLIKAQRFNSQLDLLWGPDGTTIYNQQNYISDLQVVNVGNHHVAVTWIDTRDRFTGNIYSQLLDENGDAVWLDNGLPVTSLNARQENVQVESDEAGNIYYVWEDFRNQPGYADLYIQSFDLAGTARWPENGLPVAVENLKQVRPHLASDAANGVFIVWQDERNGAWPQSDIYCQHVTANGLMSFEENGVPLTENRLYQFFPDVVTDGANGCFVTWQGVDSTGSRIKSQHVAVSGSILWEDGGSSLFAGLNGSADNVHALPWGNDQMLLMWDDDRGLGYHSALYTQTLDLSGSSIFEHDGKYLWPVTGNNDGFDMIPDGNSGAFVGFQRIGAGNYNLFAQRIDALGEPTWPNAGVPVYDQNFMDQEYAVLVKGRGGCLYYFWSEVRNFPAWFDIFVQKFDANGVPQWENGGVCITPDEPGDDYPQAAVAMADSGVVLVWQAMPEFDDMNLYASKVMPDGSVAWRETIADAPRNQEKSKVVYDAALDRFYVAWEDPRGADADVYMKFGDSDGNLSDDIIISDAVNDQSDLSLSLASDGSGVVWAAWIHATSDSLVYNSSNIWVRNMTDLADPIQISDTPSRKKDLQLQAVSADRFLAVWSDNNGYHQTGYDLYFYDSQGAGAYGQLNGELVCDALYNQVDGQIIPYPGSSPELMKYGIVWRDGRGSYFEFEGFTTHYSIYAQTYSNDFSSTASEPVVPGEFTLEPAYPNPFNGSVTIRFGQPTNAVATLRIYDLLGRQVYQKTTTQFAGNQRLNWNGQDMNGLALESGIYFLQVQIAGQTLSQKVTYLK